MGIERRIQIMESSAKITETWKKIAEDQAQMQREKSNSGMAPPPANPNFHHRVGGTHGGMMESAQEKSL